MKQKKTKGASNYNTSGMNTRVSGKTYDELDEVNKYRVDQFGYNIGDNIIYGQGFKGSILFSYNQQTAGKIIGFKEKGKYKDLYVLTSKGYTIDYYAIVEKIIL